MNRITKLVAVLLLFVFSLEGQNIEFDTLNVPFQSHTNSILINGQGHILRESKTISKDNGETWDSLQVEGKLVSAFDSSFYSFDNTYIYKYNSVENVLETVRFRTSLRDEAMDFSTDGIGNYYVINDKGLLWTSPDFGKNWTPIFSNGDLFYNRATSIAFAESDYLFFNATDENFRCNKFDGTGRINVDFFPDWILPDGSFIRKENDNILKSEDDGITWFVIIELLKIDSNYYSFECLPSGKCLFLSPEKGVFESDDLGQNWINHPFSIDGLSLRSHSSNQIFFNSKTGEYYLLNLSNWGTNFFRVSSDLNQIIPINIDFFPAEVDDFFLSDNGDIYLKAGISNLHKDYRKSTDGGITYQPYFIPGLPQFLQILKLRNSSMMIAVVKTGEVYRSIDSGTSWDRIQTITTSPDSYYTRLQQGYNGEIMISDRDKTYLSYDAGVSWFTFDAPNNQFSTHAFHPDGALYSLTSFNRNEWHFIKMLYGSLIPDTLHSYTTDISPLMLFISEKGIIFREDILIPTLKYTASISIDEGVNFLSYLAWTNEDLSLASHKRNLLNFNSQGLYLSKNEGLTWGLLTSLPVPSVQNDGTFISASDELYIFNSGGHTSLRSIYKSKASIFNFNTISGISLLDEDQNCLSDSTEIGFKNQIIKAKGDKTYYTNTNEFGDYIFFVPEGDYEISTTYNPSVWEACDSLQTVSVSGIGDSTNVDFPIKKLVDCPMLDVDLTVPFLRRCFQNKYYVSYCNNGTIVADSAYVQITLDPRFQIDTAMISWTQTTGRDYIFPVGNVAVFECGKFWFTTSHECDSVELGETICAIAHIYPDSTCIVADPAWSGASLKIDGNCDGDSIRLKIQNIGTGEMLQPRQYIIIEDVAIMRIGDPFKLPAGGELALAPIEAMGQTIHIEVPQEDRHPGNSRPSLTIEGCGELPHNLGLFNQFGQNDDDPFIDIECREVVGSYDPNDKAAVPVGLDVEHKIQPGRTIEYLIRFQNTGTDTAFTVNIIDTLSHWLDVTSFEAGASSHNYDYEISGQGTVRFKFNNILLPDSTTNEPGSNGFIKYKIAMKTDIPLGAEIFNDADIYFDYNDPIRTNETFHLVDEPWVLVKTGEVFLPKSEVKVYPNPFSESAILELQSENFKGEFTCRIFDVNGRLVSTQNSANQKIILSRKGLDAGFYFYTLRLRSGQEIEHEAIASGKLIVK